MPEEVEVPPAEQASVASEAAASNGANRLMVSTVKLLEVDGKLWRITL